MVWLQKGNQAAWKCFFKGENELDKQADTKPSVTYEKAIFLGLRLLLQRGPSIAPC